MVGKHCGVAPSESDPQRLPSVTGQVVINYDLHMMTMEIINPKGRFPFTSDFPLSHASVHPRSEDGNDNEVTGDPCPQSQKGDQELDAQKRSREPGWSKSSPEPDLQVSLKTEGVVEVVRREWRLEVLGDRASGGSRWGTAGATQSVFEKWVAKERDSQRPLTKRQLSAESSARSLRVPKKTAVREREATPPQPGPAARSACTPLMGAPKRKCRKDLFTSTDVFKGVDARVISAGKDLREQRVFSVQSITKAITQGTSSELENLRAIWVWLCHNIEYDLNGYLGLSQKLCSPEQVIEAGKGVCCGYSSICLQMCREVGIECQEVSGHGKGIGYQQGQSYQNTKSNHMWNTVRLGGHWYLLDACWGAGKADIDQKVFVKRFNDFYFLTDPEDFIDSHYPDEPQWQLLDTPIALEEFERRVFKTSEFYILGLKLVRPKHFLLVTDRGEATVSMACSHPTEFTYQISQHGRETEDIGGSYGLLTVTRLGMQLRLLPPEQGTYDVMVFARPSGASGSFGWVCSFLLECSEPKASEELPENPFLSWGLQPNALSLGVGSCSHRAEPVLVEAGHLELELQTQRPLMMVCELSHKDLDPVLAKRCLATQIQPDCLTCHVLCPYLGSYRLSVFVRDNDKTSGSFQNVGNFLLRCTGGAVNLNQLFPPSLSSFCGPGTRTAGAGLSKFSHTGAVISTQQGKVNLTFHSPLDLELHAVLAKENYKDGEQHLNRHVFFTYNDSKVTLSVTLPEAGTYRLGLYGKAAPAHDFSPLCDFTVRSSSDHRLPPFPCAYIAWQRGCVLLEPRSGVLEPHSRVAFRVRVPAARRVSVVGETRSDLSLNKSRVWEAEVFTGSPGSQLKLAACMGAESTDMAVLMAFEVLSQNNEE